MAKNAAESCFPLLRIAQYQDSPTKYHPDPTPLSKHLTSDIDQ